MSEMAYLVCARCEVSLALGKPVRDAAGSVGYFHLGSAQSPPNSARPQLTRALWKFIAEHGRDHLRIVTDYDDEFETIADYREVGGDTDNDIPLDTYLRGWPG